MMLGFGNNLMGWGFGFYGWIFMVLIWAMIIIGIVFFIKWFMTKSSDLHNQDKSPIEILKERYAKGEIDKKEFENIKKDLN